MQQDNSPHNVYDNLFLAGELLWTFVFTVSQLMEIIYCTSRDHSLQQSHKRPLHARSLTVVSSLTHLSLAIGDPASSQVSA